MDAARLPEVFNFATSGGPVTVRAFPASHAADFPRWPHRAIPAIIRRLYMSAAAYAQKEDACLICDKALVPTEGILIAVGNDFGCICAACWGLGNVERDVRATQA